MTDTDTDGWHGSASLFRSTLAENVRQSFEGHTEGGVVLDLGSGDGSYTALASRYARRTLVAERLTGKLETAVRTPDAEYPDLSVEAGDPEAVPLLDGLLAVLVLEVLDDPHPVLARWTGRLAPGGRLLAVIPRAGSWHLRMFRRWEDAQPNPLPYNGLTADDLAQILRACGLRIVSRDTFHRLPPMLLYRFGSSALGRRVGQGLAGLAERLPVGGSYDAIVAERPVESETSFRAI